MQAFHLGRVEQASFAAPVLPDGKIGKTKFHTAFLLGLETRESPTCKAEAHTIEGCRESCLVCIS